MSHSLLRTCLLQQNYRASSELTTVSPGSGHAGSRNLHGHETTNNELDMCASLGGGSTAQLEALCDVTVALNGLDGCVNVMSRLPAALLLTTI